MFAQMLFACVFKRFSSSFKITQDVGAGDYGRGFGCLHEQGRNVQNSKVNQHHLNSGFQSQQRQHHSGELDRQAGALQERLPFRAPDGHEAAGE